MKVIPHVMRNINEFNIPAGNANGYEILYFGVNLILMFDYRFGFDIEVKNSDYEIQVLTVSRKDILAWGAADGAAADAAAAAGAKATSKAAAAEPSQVIATAAFTAYILYIFAALLSRNRSYTVEALFNTSLAATSCQLLSELPTNSITSAIPVIINTEKANLVYSSCQVI
jgi:hypothetical protein